MMMEENQEKLLGQTIPKRSKLQMQRRQNFYSVAPTSVPFPQFRCPYSILVLTVVDRIQKSWEKVDNRATLEE